MEHLGWVEDSYATLRSGGGMTMGHPGWVEDSCRSPRLDGGQLWSTQVRWRTAVVHLVGYGMAVGQEKELSLTQLQHFLSASPSCPLGTADRAVLELG